MTERKERRGGPRFGNPSGTRGRPRNPTPPGTQHVRLDRSYPLPCAVHADTESGICGRDAYAAIAWQQKPSHPWPTPGLWTLQPICKECAERAAAQYQPTPKEE